MAKPSGHPHAHEIVAAARACVGALFRPQGRGVGGYDCLGVVVVAARQSGAIFAEPEAYGLRGTSIGFAREKLLDMGCKEIPLQQISPGDILLSQPAFNQIHFAVATDMGFVEANASLRRIVERPHAADDKWQSAWRLPSGGS